MLQKTMMNSGTTFGSNTMNMLEGRMNHLKSLGVEPKFILDVGAHVASWSKQAKEVYPDSEYLLIEANEENEPVLLQSGFPYRIALLGDEKKSVDYYAIKPTGKNHNTGNSIFKENTSHYSGDKYVVRNLPMTTLDSVLETHWVQEPDFLKMDVQGAELIILDGAPQTLKTLDYVLLETQLVEYNDKAPLFTEVNAHMDKLGFQMMDLWGMHYFPQTSALFQLDILYARKDSKLVSTEMIKI